MPTSPVELTYARARPTFGQINRPSARVDDRPSELSRNIASPNPLRKRGPLKTPADCLAFPLLHDFNRRDWPLWFEAHGTASPNSRKGPAFSDGHLIVRAAVSGQGLGLVRDIYAEGALRANQLVKPLSVNWPLQFAYYVVATSEALQKPSVRRFKDWLIGEARKEISPLA